MNEEQALAQLRDIHIPTVLDRVITAEFATWPFAVLALVVLLIVIVRFWRRKQWRRRVKTDLSRILSLEDQAAQWSLLLEFATGLSARLGRPVTLPRVAFMRPDDLSEQQKSEFIGFLSTELER